MIQTPLIFYSLSWCVREIFDQCQPVDRCSHSIIGDHFQSRHFVIGTAVKLVAHRIPRAHVGAVSQAEPDLKKQALSEKLRQGSVRLLIGSTQKLGTSINRKRQIALHHADALWKPTEVDPREGRRPVRENENEEMAIYMAVAHNDRLIVNVTFSGPTAESYADLQRLNMLQKNHLEERYSAQRYVGDSPDAVATLSGRIVKIEVRRSDC